MNSEYLSKTDGGMRDPSEEEMELSPHGSFTKVHPFSKISTLVPICVKNNCLYTIRDAETTQFENIFH